MEVNRLFSALQIGRVPDEEVVEVLGSVLPLRRWESGNRVSYLHPEQGHVLNLVYTRRGRVAACEPGPGLTDDLVEEIANLGQAALGSDTGHEVRRQVLFSMPEAKGYWRHGDEWQILPAPPEAPRPTFLMGEFPFVLEYRIRSSSNTAIAFTRSRRRAWELHLVLSLLLRGRITRESDAKPHHWVLPEDPSAEAARAAYLNEGYTIEGGFVPRAENFSHATAFPRLTVVPDEEYYARRGFDPEHALDVPASLDDIFNRFEQSDPQTRDRLLRAAYWLDAAYRVWDMSKALSYVAAIFAVEALVPSHEAEPCPCCGLDRSPGPTARFRDFVEKYAASTEEAPRQGLYELRSKLVHGHRLHALDLPRAWGALTPRDEEFRDLHDAALGVARSATRRWFLDVSGGAAPSSSSEQAHDA
jgi:hypothetical protein